MSFQFPEMWPMSTVELSNDPSGSDRMAGFVTAVKGQAVDVLVITSEGIGMRRDVWHEDDPRCIEHPDHFANNISGVFRLTEGEIQRRQLIGRMDALENRLATTLAELQEKEEVVPPKPRRGRPPKKRDPEPALA